MNAKEFTEKILMDTIVSYVESSFEDFFEIRRKYQESLEKLKLQIDDKLGLLILELKSAVEEQICTTLIFSEHLGKSASVDYQKNPSEHDFLAYDFEIFLKERVLQELPAYRSSQKYIEDFFEKHCHLCGDLLDSILDYKIYLETVGAKLAHYYGFMNGSYYMGKMNYDYCMKYKKMLEAYLEINLSEFI